MNNKVTFLRILVLVLFVVLGIVLLFDFQKKPKTITNPTESPQIANPAFCGSSSHKKCSADSDCVAGGCSGQICQSTNDEQVITTCEYKNCYDAKKYGLSCGCFFSECQWHK